MKEHPRAELLRAIADGRQMQMPSADDPQEWRSTTAEGALYRISQGMRVRIKPATILVNGIEVVKGMEVAPADGDTVWLADIYDSSYASQCTWATTNHISRWLQRGLCHTTEAAAVAHAKAMLAPSMKGGE